MQVIGHQVVGSEHKSHEDVKVMYEKFFGGEAVKVKRMLKKGLGGSIEAREMLNHIFKVQNCMYNSQLQYRMHNISLHAMARYAITELDDKLRFK